MKPITLESVAKAEGDWDAAQREYRARQRPNYTTEREQWLGNLTLEEIDAEIKHLKLKGDI